MKFTVNKEERYVEIVPEEQNITAVFAPALKTEFILYKSEGFNNIICDLNQINYVDSSGLSSFLVGQRLCAESGGKFVMCNLNDSVMKLIKLSQLDSIMDITPTKSEAVDLILLNELEKDLRE